MRSSLWLTTAAAALIAAAGFANAQTGRESGPGEGSTMQHGSTAKPTQGGTEQKGGSHTGQTNAGPKSSEKMGEEHGKSPTQHSATGQGESKEHMGRSEGREEKERMGQGESKEHMGRGEGREDKDHMGQRENKEHMGRGEGREDKDHMGQRENKERTGRGEGREDKEHMGQGESKDRMGRGEGREDKDRVGQGESKEHRGEGGRVSVQLSQQQRTRIRDVVIHGHSEARIEHPDFSVSIGAVIPRSVHVYTVPRDVVEIVPQYEGFDYIIVGDEIVILEPDTLRIVAVIPA